MGMVGLLRNPYMGSPWNACMGFQADPCMGLEQNPRVGFSAWSLSIEIELLYSLDNKSQMEAR